MNPISSSEAILALIKNLAGGAGKGLELAGKGIGRGAELGAKAAPGIGKALSRTGELAKKFPKSAGGLGLGGAVGAGYLASGDDDEEEGDDIELSPDDYELLIKSHGRR